MAAVAACRQAPTRDDLPRNLPAAGNTGHGLATQASVLDTCARTVMRYLLIAFPIKVMSMDYSTGHTNGYDDLREA